MTDRNWQELFQEPDQLVPMLESLEADVDSGGGQWGLASTVSLSGPGSPQGQVTPGAIGDLFIDLTKGKLYQADGLTNDDWDFVGGPDNYYEPLGSPSATSIANGATGSLAFLDVVGNNIFDFTTPTAPVAVEDGIYSIQVQAKPGAMTTGGSFEMILALDVENENIKLQGTSPSSVISQATPNLVLTSIAFIPEGNSFTCSVISHDGSASRNFAVVQGWIQKIK